ncbi:MAG: histone deacetylase [Gemmatimonadaceae bacterium]
MPLHAWTSARFRVPLPAGHRFPIEKYALLRDAVLGSGVVAPEHLHEPARVPVDALLRAHTHDYVTRVTGGALSPHEIRRVGFPWSAMLVERALRAAGGTLEAAQHALGAGVAMNLAGGTHHAFADRGEGFCVFNDVVVAIRQLQFYGRIQRAAVIDLDVHQGNGTHAMLADDPRVVTFSMHGRRNYPFHKVPGTLDIELDDGTGDDEYLACLADALPTVLARSRPDLVLYLAGADPHEGDRLGRLRLTFDGLARRDAMVLDACRDVGIPVAIVIAGGYGRDIQTTVEVHRRTAAIAAEYT